MNSLLSYCAKKLIKILKIWGLSSFRLSLELLISATIDPIKMLSIFDQFLEIVPLFFQSRQVIFSNFYPHGKMPLSEAAIMACEGKLNISKILPIRILANMVLASFLSNLTLLPHFTHVLRISTVLIYNIF